LTKTLTSSEKQITLNNASSLFEIKQVIQTMSRKLAFSQRALYSIHKTNSELKTETVKCEGILQSCVNSSLAALSSLQEQGQRLRMSFQKANDWEKDLLKTEMELQVMLKIADIVLSRYVLICGCCF
jgi:hypothetical protein